MLRILLVIASATSTTRSMWTNAHVAEVRLELAQSVTGEIFPFVARAGVRILEVPGPLPALLPREFGGDQRVGQPLGTLGFPADLAGETGVLVWPTFKEGTLSALLRSTPMIFTEPIPWT